jgi:hypothetical protein
MYVDLRKNIISTVYNSWQSTGFAWEQYNAETGAGQRTQGFTGWTALLVNILAMPDFAKAATSEKLELPSDFRPAMDDIFSMAALLFFVVLVFGIAFALKACYMSRYAGYTGIVQRPSPHLYLRMRHITSYI